MNGITMREVIPAGIRQRTGETVKKSGIGTDKASEIKSNITETDRTEFAVTTELSAEAKLREDAEKLLAELAGRYKDIHITVGGQKTGDDITKIAAALGRGTHLLISEEFLKRMCGSEEEFQKCGKILEEVMKKLWGQEKEAANGAFVGKSEAVFWSAGQTHGNANEGQAGAAADPYPTSGITNIKQNEKMKIKSNFRCNVARRYSKMAGANSKDQIHTLMSEVRRDIMNLRMASAFGDREEQLKANRIIRSLDKLLTRGGRKIRRLNKEELVAARERKAERERERQESLRASLELKKRKNARLGEDKALIMEGLSEQARLNGCRYYQRARDAYLLESRLTGAPPYSFGLSGIGEGCGITGGEIAAADVSVTDTMSF